MKLPQIEELKRLATDAISLGKQVNASWEDWYKPGSFPDKIGDMVDQHYIAKVSPETILELIEYIEKLERLVEETRKAPCIYCSGGMDD